MGHIVHNLIFNLNKTLYTNMYFAFSQIALRKSVNTFSQKTMNISNSRMTEFSAFIHTFRSLEMIQK